MKILEENISRIERVIDTVNEELAKQIAFDRKRISALENPTPVAGVVVKDRIARLENYIQQKSNHYATFLELRGLLGVDKDSLRHLLMYLDGDRYEVVVPRLDRRRRSLRLKAI